MTKCCGINSLKLGAIAGQLFEVLQYSASPSCLAVLSGGLCTSSLVGFMHAALYAFFKFVHESLSNVVPEQVGINTNSFAVPTECPNYSTV